MLQGQLGEGMDLQPPHYFGHHVQVDAGSTQGVFLLIVHPLHELIQQRTEYGQGTPTREASGTNLNKE
jgi:hypothetical protein